MIGIDTNVLVRYLTQDEPRQAALATRFVEQRLSEVEPGYVCLVVLVETVWVLQRAYRATSQEILETINDLLNVRTLVFENRDVVQRAVAVVARSGCGFSDAIIAASAQAAGCSATFSFDRKAERAGMTTLRASESRR